MTMVARAEALVPELAEQSEAIEAARRVPAGVSAKVGEAGLYHMLAPAAVGGGEVHPSTFAAALEVLATGDAAVAWTAMTSATSAGTSFPMAPGFERRGKEGGSRPLRARHSAFSVVADSPNRNNRQQQQHVPIALLHVRF